jgi:hypothetical protein
MRELLQSCRNIKQQQFETTWHHISSFYHTSFLAYQTRISTCIVRITKQNLTMVKAPPAISYEHYTPTA